MRVISETEKGSRKKRERRRNRVGIGNWDRCVLEIAELKRGCGGGDGDECMR